MQTVKYWLLRTKKNSQIEQSIQKNDVMAQWNLGRFYRFGFTRLALNSLTVYTRVDRVYLIRTVAVSYNTEYIRLTVWNLYSSSSCDYVHFRASTNVGKRGIKRTSPSSSSVFLRFSSQLFCFYSTTSFPRLVSSLEASYEAVRTTSPTYLQRCFLGIRGFSRVLFLLNVYMDDYVYGRLSREGFTPKTLFDVSFGVDNSA